MSKELPRVLIVDDEVCYAQDIALALKKDFECEVVPDAGAGMSLFETISYDLVLLDIDLRSSENGIDLLRRMKRLDAGVPAIMLTKVAELESIVASIKAGAFYYVIKGTGSVIHELKHMASLAIEDAARRRAVAPIDTDGADPLGRLVGVSPAIRKIKEDVHRVAEADCEVLIVGASGTGKEIIAQAIHELSGRSRRGRFVPMNCAALPEHLAESELFGHVKGAFTSAERDRIGKFKYADRGTLFLDEIGDMPKGAQAKILRVMQEKTFSRVGENSLSKTDARVISATNHDLDKLVARGEFRDDLLFRINQYTIHVPPLSERREDIGPIAAFKAREMGRRIKGAEMAISRSAVEELASRDWRRSNVRELENAIAGAIIRCDGDTIRMGDLSYESYGDEESIPEYDEAKRRVMEQFKRRYLTQLLRATGGNVAAAARKAGILAPAFHKHMNDVDLSADDFRKAKNDEF